MAPGGALDAERSGVEGQSRGDLFHSLGIGNRVDLGNLPSTIVKPITLTGEPSTVTITTRAPFTNA